MTYRCIGLMSGSSLDGLDLVFAEFIHQGGDWTFEIIAADCYEYDEEWKDRLVNAVRLNAYEYQLLHAAYGRYLGQQVNRFIENHQLQFRVGLVASHGHTTFHAPQLKMTAQLGDGAAIAAETRLPVVSDLRALDVAFGGQGAPIVPIGEKLLLKEYDMFLNLGGIANISFADPAKYIAFDVCPANRVLNMLAGSDGKEFDAEGQMAAMGNINEKLLEQLNELPYYRQPFPKSLPNSFGTETVYRLVRSFGLTHNDELRTMTEHIVMQVQRAADAAQGAASASRRLLVTGGGAFNTFLVERLTEALGSIGITVVVPGEELVKYKEALVMALIGVLRWRQENNVLHSVTGASQDSIGGAVWIGQDA
ncbi:MAG TPA: anhydro-N-acetylmuramic acid kinase [Flavisolibacter sp.]